MDINDESQDITTEEYREIKFGQLESMALCLAQTYEQDRLCIKINVDKKKKHVKINIELFA
jgi:hypothetical protein